MWPFRKTVIDVPLPSMAEQAGAFALALKSLSLPQATPKWNLFARSQTDWLYKAAIEEGFKASAVVYAAVEKRARCISSVRLVAERRVGGEWTPEPDSRLQQLLDNPNPDMDCADFLHRVSQHLDLAGNAFISEIHGGIDGDPIALWPLNPQFTKIKPGSVTLIEYYEYQEANGRPTRINDVDMIHLSMPNPDSVYFGMPVLQGAARAVDVDREAGVWQKCSLQNRGVTDFNIKLPESATQQQVDMVKASYADRQAGPRNARKPFISTAEFQNLDRSAVEMDFVSSRQKTWTEIAAVFGTPLAVLGFTEDVNLANAETMRRLLWQDTIAPQIGLICRQLTGQLAVDFGPDWRIMPDFTGVQAMEQDFGERLDNAQKLWSMGVPFNEINQRLGLGFDPIEGGDIGYLSAGVLPVGYDPLDDAMTPDEPDTTKADAMLRALKAIGYGA